MGYVLGCSKAARGDFRYWQIVLQKSKIAQ